MKTIEYSIKEYLGVIHCLVRITCTEESYCEIKACIGRVMQI